MMNMKWKTKNNMKARINIHLFCYHKNIKLVYDRSRVIKPKANFTLDKNAQLIIYYWLMSLYFSDRYASNLRLVNLEDDILYIMKSHDHHVFMITLIPFAYRDLLPKVICDALIKTSHFFRDTCCNKLHTQPNIWRSLKWISSRKYVNLRWYSLHQQIYR